MPLFRLCSLQWTFCSTLTLQLLHAFWFVLRYSDTVKLCWLIPWYISVDCVVVPLIVAFCRCSFVVLVYRWLLFYIDTITDIHLLIIHLWPNCNSARYTVVPLFPLFIWHSIFHWHHCSISALQLRWPSLLVLPMMHSTIVYSIPLFKLNSCSAQFI